MLKLKPKLYSIAARLIFTTLLVGVLSAMVSAQTDTGRISGTVKDQNGAIVQGASVIAKNERTGEERATTTNADGTFSIPALKAAVYTVTASTSGLGARVSKVEVNIGQESTLSLTLSIAELTASINVTSGEEIGVTTSSASIGANVNPREVEGLPINGRQLSQLYLQAPGSVNSGSGTYGDIRFSGRAVE